MFAKSILVVVDPTRDQAELMVKVGRVASGGKASIELYVCDTESSSGDSVDRFGPYEAAREALRRKRLRDLDHLAVPLREAGHAASVEAAWFEPLHEGILRHVRAKNPDLVMKEARRHVPIARSVYVHTDHHLIAECPAPLLLVGPEPWPARLDVVAAIDPCHAGERPIELDRAVLSSAARLADALQATSSTVHVLAEGAGPAERRAVSSFVDANGGSPSPLEFLSGDPAVQLGALAAKRGGLILVMGATARSKPRQPLIGGFASRVIDIPQTTILVVKQ